ncbi:MAG: imidazole glycerol phosphate synthase subunit HisF [Deltaproteobacteria bacterium]|nr:MAG: imidazole glycerol phosphate synthase subunit HisF [Deltaproteobacteria bacterium]
MLKKRIIACLDVKDGKVVKGVKFKNHEILGDILEFAKAYSDAGIDELVFYDITASPRGEVVDTQWIKKLSNVITIPFSVAGGISTLKDAENVLSSGAEKISVNSMALKNPELITEIANRFGSQAIVVGIDCLKKGDEYRVFQMTGDPKLTSCSGRLSIDWAKEAQERGAGEIVLNCMDQDGVRRGYDLFHTKYLASELTIPVVASGGAGSVQDFVDIFTQSYVSGALAASIFHKGLVSIKSIKESLKMNNIPVRML